MGPFVSPWRWNSVAKTVRGGRRLQNRVRRVLPTQQETRNLATSAEKRKWNRDGINIKRERRLQEAKEYLQTTVEKDSSRLQKDTANGNPFLFLVLFPVAMTAVVVMLRDDLQEELAEMGRSVRREK